MSDPITEDDLRAVLESVGEDCIRKIVANFYTQVPDDPVLGPMYPADDMDGAETRLADFLVYRLGGSTTYIETRGHPRLRMRHMPFKIDTTARDAWIRCMGNAVSANIHDAAVRQTLLAFLGGVAQFLVNRAS